MNITTGLTNEIRRQALILFLDEGLEEDDVSEERWSSDHTEFTIGRRSYLVLTEEEANQQAREDIECSLWEFNAEFIVDYMPIKNSDRVVRSIRKMQEELSEDANDLMEALVKDKLDELVQDAINADGRGHFMNTYDGEENEITIFIHEEEVHAHITEFTEVDMNNIQRHDLYIYRIN